MRGFVELEVNDDVAAQEAVVEDQIDEVVVFIELKLDRKSVV